MGHIERFLAKQDMTRNNEDSRNARGKYDFIYCPATINWIIQGTKCSNTLKGKKRCPGAAKNMKRTLYDNRDILPQTSNSRSLQAKMKKVNWYMASVPIHYSDAWETFNDELFNHSRWNNLVLTTTKIINKIRPWWSEERGGLPAPQQVPKITYTPVLCLNQALKRRSSTVYIPSYFQQF